MTKYRYGPFGRTLLAFFCLIFTAVAVLTGLLTLFCWDDLWSGGDYANSASIREPLYTYRQKSFELQELLQQKQWGVALSDPDEQRVEHLQTELSSAVTNYRFEIRNESGELFYTNLPAGAGMNDTISVRTVTTGLSRDEGMHHADYITEDPNTGLSLLMVWAGEENAPYLSFGPADQRDSYNQYGWLFNGLDWEYSSDEDERVQAATLTLTCGVQWPLLASDLFFDDYQTYRERQQYLPTLAIAAAATSLLSLVLLFFFCRSAGYRRKVEGLTLNWQDRIPLDLYLVCLALGISVLLHGGDSASYHINQGANSTVTYVGFSFFALAIDALILACLHTCSVRIKARTLLRNTLIWRVLAWVGRFVRKVAMGWKVTKRPVLTFVLYLIGTVLTGVTIFLIPVYQGFVLWCLCRWVRQWRSIRDATAHIVGGDPDCHIDTLKMYPDLAEHAGQLNDLGSAINTAVDERMKSERFKTELITNVSHDLKTPLTSIINYVDLLKKEDILDPKAQEYIEVLDRKSQRLKKLTEDLVEASKASTGTLSVNREVLGFTQLLEQALGEYEVKFQAAGLTPVPSFPAQELYVEADGRHLWRVIDNLLGNCCKYAMQGTRLYLDVTNWNSTVTLVVKNISQNPLNIPSEQLMERFVRGEASRTTDGSGLGLSIARSLTELQGGDFRLDIDGDLFKVVVSFPACQPPTLAPSVIADESPVE